ncbi:MAG TPA: hypothetical protein PK919_09215 [Candidatus Aminicenantes bacterium]|nr:hypothetical protein [Candidatus Aminicenantes bacterium]
MKIYSGLDLVIGVAAFFLGAVQIARGGTGLGALTMVAGAALAYIGFRGGRLALLLFGHGAVIAGCYLAAWGLTLPPLAKPEAADILGRPLFWGLFAIGGGVCAILQACGSRFAGRGERPPA